LSLPFNRNGEDYQSIFENAVEGIFQTSLDGHIIKVNPAMARIYGYKSAAEMVATIKNISKQIYINEKDRKIFVTILQEDGIVEGFEAQNVRKDGSKFWSHTNARIVKDDDGNNLFIEGFLTDITSRKEAEKALQESEEQFKTIFQANPVAMCITTLDDGRFVDANQAYWDLSEFEPDEVLNLTGIDLGFITAKKRKIFISKLKKENSLKFIRGKFATKSGAILSTLEFYELIQLHGNYHLLSMFYDITEQTESQTALQDNEEKYRQLFEAESDTIFLIDNDSGNILEANVAATKLYGYSKEELLRRKNSDLSAEPEETRKVTRKTPVNYYRLEVDSFVCRMKFD